MLTMLPALAALGLAPTATALLIDGLATVLGVFYILRAKRLNLALLANRLLHDAGERPLSWRNDRLEQRLMARSLRHTIRMTAHFGQFPQSAPRGYALARALRDAA